MSGCIEQSKVSIIVPVYNCELYIERCVQSLLNQTYKNLQIIIINDGSNDNTINIINKLKREDNRIEVLTQDNAGVSSARNAGLGLAQGRYLLFVDSDDKVSDRYVEELVYAIADVELGVSGYYKVDESGHIRNSSVKNEIDEISMTGMEFVKYIFDGRKFGYQGCIWNKIFLNDIIKINGIKFDSDISYNEDRLFVFDYLLLIKRVSLINKPLYYYYQNQSSAMAAVKHNFKKDMLSEIRAFDNMLDKSSDTSDRNLSKLISFAKCRAIIRLLQCADKQSRMWLRKSLVHSLGSCSLKDMIKLIAIYFRGFHERI